MDAELYLTEDKLVVSKQGFDAANPSLPEGDKLFDSDWLFSGTVVAAGVHVDQAGYYSGRPPQNVIQWDVRTWESANQYIYFGSLSFVPTVLLMPLSDSRYWQENGAVLLGADKKNRNVDYIQRMGEITIDQEKITIPRVRLKNTSGDEWYFREDFMYLVMAM